VRSIADSGAAGGIHGTGSRVRLCILCSRGRRPPCLLLLLRPEQHMQDTLQGPDE
jgi:hypothetical protein